MGGARAIQGHPKPNPLSGWNLVKRPEARGKGEKGKMSLDSRLALVLAGSGGLIVGLVLGRYWGWLGKLKTYHPVPANGPGQQKKRSGGGSLPIEQMANQYEDYKMVLVVRNDLKMGKGKVAAQCGHATLGLFKLVAHRAPRSIEKWDECGQTKIVVKVETEEEMLIVQDKARCEGIPSHIVVDAGRTQIAANSRTVMALLGPEEVLTRVSGHLKLL